MHNYKNKESAMHTRLLYYISVSFALLIVTNLSCEKQRKRSRGALPTRFQHLVKSLSLIPIDMRGVFCDGTLLRWGTATAGNSWCRDIGRSPHVRHLRIYSLGKGVNRGNSRLMVAPKCLLHVFNGGQALWFL